jgi:thiamine biosynthesis lipoprotein ApbE
MLAEVDAQMSAWKPDSDLMRFNACTVGECSKAHHFVRLPSPSE